MTASYDPTLSLPKDQVRFKVGDTVVSPTDAAALSDEEITAQLTANGGSVIKAALACVRFLIAKYSRMSSISVGDTSIQAEGIARQYRALLDDLTRETALNGDAVPFTGGLTYSSKDEANQDPDRVPPFFARDDDGMLPRRRDPERLP